jgi:hypothetical protein
VISSKIIVFVILLLHEGLKNDMLLYSVESGAVR